MRIELKHRITHDGITYEPGVHDLPEDLCRQFLAKGPWAAAPLAKIRLTHPITHDGTEYGRGIHELPESLVRFFLKTAPHAAVPCNQGEPTPSAEQMPGAPNAGPTDRAEVSATDKTESLGPYCPQKWQDVEIVFLSEFRLQVRNQEPLHYAELDFADTRGKDKPNSAWLTFRKLAESHGRIMIAKSDPKRAQLEKEIQQIRKKLREHFGIPEDPLPFIKDETRVGYRAEFKVSCSSVYHN